MAEGSYEAISEKLFNEAEVDTFFLEYESERAGGFEPLRHVPKNKNVVLGLVSSKTPKLGRARRAQATGRGSRALHCRSIRPASARNVDLRRASAETP